MKHLYQNLTMNKEGEAECDKMIELFEDFEEKLISHDLDLASFNIVKAKLENVFYYIKKAISDKHPGVPTPKEAPIPAKEQVKKMKAKELAAKKNKGAK